jgi:hypothetical protein
MLSREETNAANQDGTETQVARISSSSGDTGFSAGFDAATACPAETPEDSNTIVVPAGTRLSLQMANAISTRDAKPGHPVFF